jgi:ribosomal protein S18 acetylase RimI-like enzyme
MSTPGNPEVVVRPLQGPQEAQACARMMAGSEPWLTLRFGYEFCLQRLTESSREVYVAVAQEAVAGFVILNLGGPFKGYVQTIAVMPEWRSRGLGVKLMAFAEERIFREAPNVFLCVSSFNTEAQRFYARLGYERVGEIKDYVVQGHSEYLMRKTMGPMMAS